MEPILVPLFTYHAENPTGPGPWPKDAIVRRAKLVQYKVELDLRMAGLPHTELSADPQYAGNSLILPISTWEAAVNIEMGRLGRESRPAVKVPEGWTTARAYAETYSRNQDSRYLGRVSSHASRTDPLPAGPYGTRRPEIWSKSFLRVRP